MPRLICLRCHFIVEDGQPLPGPSAECSQEHDWVSFDSVVGAYQKSARGRNTNEEVFGRIVSTIDQAFKVSKYISPVALFFIILGGGYLFFSNFFTIPALQKKLNKQIGIVNEATQHLTVAYDIYSGIANTLNVIQLRLDSLRVEAFSPQSMKALGIGRGEYEILLSEYFYVRNRLHDKFNELTCRKGLGAVPNTEQDCKPAKPEVIRSWGNAVAEFLEGFRVLMRRNQDDKQNYFETGKKSFRRAIDKDPTFSEPFIKLAAIYLNPSSREMPEADKNLSQALKLDPKNPEALALKGLYLYLTGKTAQVNTEARKILEKAHQDLGPNDKPYPEGIIVYTLGQVYEKDARKFIQDATKKKEAFKKAFTYYERTLSIFPYHDRAKNNLASLISEGLVPLNETNYTPFKLIRIAFEAIEHASPDVVLRATRMDTLGLLYHYLREFESAINEFHRAVDLFPADDFQKHYFEALGCGLHLRSKLQKKPSPVSPDRTDPQWCQKRGENTARSKREPPVQPFAQGLVDLGRFYFLAAQRESWMERSAKKTFQQWSIWKEISKRAPDDSVKREYEVQRYLYREAIESVAEGLLQAKDDKDPSNQRFHRGSAWTRLADYFLSGFETLRIADKYYRKGGTIELTLNELKSFQKLLKEERILPQETSGAPSSGQDDKLWGYKLAHRLYLRALSPSHELHPDLFQEEMALRFDHSSNNFAWSGLFMEQDSGVLAILDVSRKAIRKRFFAPRDFKEKEDRPELYDTLAEVYSRTGDQKKAYDLTDESLLLLKSEIEKLKKLKDRFDQVHTPYATLNSEAVARRLERLERRRGYYLCQINRFQGMIKKEPSQEASNIKGQIRK